MWWHVILFLNCLLQTQDLTLYLLLSTSSLNGLFSFPLRKMSLLKTWHNSFKTTFTRSMVSRSKLFQIETRNVLLTIGCLMAVGPIRLSLHRTTVSESGWCFCFGQLPKTVFVLHTNFINFRHFVPSSFSPSVTLRNGRGPMGTPYKSRADPHQSGNPTIDKATILGCALFPSVDSLLPFLKPSA